MSEPCDGDVLTLGQQAQYADELVTELNKVNQQIADLRARAKELRAEIWEVMKANRAVTNADLRAHGVRV